MRRAIRLLGATVAAGLAMAPAASAVTTASVSGSTLTVNGDAAANHIIVWLPGGDGINAGYDPPRVDPPNLTDPYVVETRAPETVSAGAGCTSVNPQRADCSRGGAAYGSFTVRINGLAGGDYVHAHRPQQPAPFDDVFISGGEGNDALFGSQNGDWISGDAGDDLMDGGAGADFMSGGTLNAPVPSPEGGVSQPGSYTPGPGAGVDRVFGGNFDDQITDGDNDTAAGQLNSDHIDGGVCAAPNGPGETMPPGLPATAPATCPQLPGNVDGPEDHDAYMLGHRTQPLVIDILVATASQGGPGENEQIRRIEAVWGGSGNDRLYGRDGDLGDESLRGNGGNDHLEARGGDDELIGGDGQDTLLGGPGADILWPGGHIISPPGAPTEMVNDGPDVVDGGPNSTIVGGHSMTDLVTYDGRTDNLRLDLTQPNTFGAPGENDSIANVEDLMGGHRDDVIVGNALQNLISGDPAAFVFNVPPDPPAYPAAPGGHAGNDNINTRGDGPDTVDCTEGTADVHVADAHDGSINCENQQRPPQCSDGVDNDGDTKTDHPADPGCESAADVTESPDPPVQSSKPTISGPANAGRITVKKDGSFTLTRNVITCPNGSAACKVTNAVRAAKGKTKYGSRSYTLRAGAKGAARSKLTKKRLSTLKKRKSMRARVAVKVVMGGQTTSRAIRVTLKAPKRAKKRR